MWVWDLPGFLLYEPVERTATHSTGGTRRHDDTQHRERETEKVESGNWIKNDFLSLFLVFYISRNGTK